MTIDCDASRVPELYLCPYIHVGYVCDFVHGGHPHEV